MAVGHTVVEGVPLDQEGTSRLVVVERKLEEEAVVDILGHTLVAVVVHMLVVVELAAVGVVDADRRLKSQTPARMQHCQEFGHPQRSDQHPCAVLAVRPSRNHCCRALGSK